MTKRLLVTGSRDWTDSRTMALALTKAWHELGGVGVVLVHGGARGADTMAEQIGKRIGFEIERHPADWSMGKAAGHIRNQRMVDLGADLCLAFPIGESRGTRHCMALAVQAGIPMESIPAQREDR